MANISGAGTTASGTITKISAFTVSGNTIGREMSITVPAMVNRPTYTFTLQYNFGTDSGDLVAKKHYEGNGVWKWSVPLSLAEQIPNAQSGTCSITCTAYKPDGTVANSTTKSVTLKTESGLVRPFFLEYAARDINEATLALTGDSRRIIPGHSVALAAFKAETLYGATFAAASIANVGGLRNPVAASGASIEASLEFRQVKSSDFEFRVEDSRGYETTAKASYIEVPYTPVSCTVQPDVPQPDGVMAFKVSGAWFGKWFGACYNSVSVYYRTKAGDDEWGAWLQVDPANVATDETSYEAQASIKVDYSRKVTIQAKAVDLLTEAVSEEKTVRAFPVFYWGENDFMFNVPLHLKGGLYFDEWQKAVYAMTEGGECHNVFQGRNKNGHTLIGWDNYANADGNTHLYGNDVKIGVANVATPTVYTPYIRQGNVVTVAINTAGVCTNNKADVIFFVPFSKPIIGSPTVAASSPNNGFILRQGGGYTHGSGVSKFVKPDSYEAVVRPNHGVHIVASFSTLTNAVNNAPIGVYWSGTLTFS